MRRITTFLLIIAVLGPARAFAQAEPTARSVRLLVGRSTIIDVGTPITRVSLTSADIADALVTSPRELLVNGKNPGTISMFVWDRGGAIQRYEIVVQRDLARLTEQVKQLFPGEAIDVRSNGKNIVLAGLISNKDVADKAVSVAAGYVEKKEEVVSLLQVREGGASNQVLLRVRFAEVSRSALTELGAGFFTSPTGVKNTIGRVTTQQFPVPGFDDLQYTKPDAKFGTDPTTSSGKFTFSDFLNLFLFSEKFDLGLMVKALQSRGLFQSLAEPNLVAESGKEASFLAGGEFPIPIAQASAGGAAITVQFKEFGIRLTFTPVVNGNRVHLKVRPEVSTLDFSNGIVLQGFRIPALSTRRTETELELLSGQTFAIAGLMNNTVNKSLQKVPGIGDIPILGLLFRSEAAQKNRSELVVMITPEILPNNSNGVTPNLPRQTDPYLPPLSEQKSFDPPPPAFPAAARGTASVTTPAPAEPLRLTPDGTATDSAKAAAAAVTALTPNTRTVVQPTAPAAKPAPAPTAAGSRPAASTPAVSQPAAPSAVVTPPAPAAPVSVPAETVSRPLTADELKALERARKQEREQAQVDMRVKAAEAKRLGEQAAQERRQQQVDQERQAVLQREQAKRNAEIAQREAEAARRSAEEAKRQAERQAEIDRRRQKAIEEAEAKIKEAEERYRAEVQKQRQ